MKQDKNEYNSPSEIADHLKITYVPTYLLATAVALLIAAFIVWGILGNVSVMTRNFINATHKDFS